MDSGKSVRNLAETLHSLLGLKAHITSNWVKSVSDIIKTLPSEKSVDLQPTDFNTNGDDPGCGAISKIKDELAVLTKHINQLNAKRRQILNELLDLKGNIRVFCRIRPITSGDNISLLRPVVASDTNKVLLKLADNKSKSYNFDKVFLPGSSQDEVFSEVEPLVKSVLDGYNACIIAYGQTGTGKTFTMEGTADAPGIVPRAIEALFKQALDSNHSFLISFSMLEIYMGNLKDLLVPKPTKATVTMPPCISIKTDAKGEVEIDNLVTIKVNDFNQALRLYRLGCGFRSTASTNSNIASSRSHCMIRIVISCHDAPERRRETNKIWLVDLGGSERVLKTKAWGKRLDEGKAINLSLSALGDVISALQRKQHHIPYRNSKLTQVLKDSLGDDSKTVMLVHVSPKEEDLCETICSLNFATRVKSVHLGNENTIEAKEQKEVAMADLRQKMKHIEDDRLCVRRDIEKLNKRLENLTETYPSSERQLEQYQIEEPCTMNGIVDVVVTPLPKLPRFMRPTICSRRKSGRRYQTSEEGYDTVLARRKRPTSNYAESASFPVKVHSEYNSERSISRSSCLTGLGTRTNADNATECSQETSETDFKPNSYQEQGRAQRSLISQKSGTSHIPQNSSGHLKDSHLKFSKVDSWLHLQTNAPILSGRTQREKQFLAVPNPKKIHRSNVQSKEDKIFNKKAHDYAHRMQEDANHDKKQNLVTAGAVGKHVPEMVIENPLKTLKDLFCEESRCDLTSSSQTSEAKTTIQTQDYLHGSLTGDSEYGTFSPTERRRVEEYEGDDGINTMPITQAIEGKTQCSDCFLLKNSGCECYPSEFTTFVCSKRDSGGSISAFELESCCQQARAGSNIEGSEREDFNPPFQSRHVLLQLRSQKALFTSSENQENLTVPFGKPEEKRQNTGLCHNIKQRIQIVCFTALLGLGLYNLGLDHDFFYGLTR